MMNKAEKRFREMEVVKDIYGYVNIRIEDDTRELNYWRNLKADTLEENPEENTEYYDGQIECLVVRISKAEEVAEKLLKLM